MAEPELFIELFESNGPVSPKYHEVTTITVRGAADGGAVATLEHKDASGTKTRARDLDPPAVTALLAALFAAVPEGTAHDLVGEKRTRKGVAFNHVEIRHQGKVTRLDYLLSAIDDDPRVAEVSSVLRALV